MSYAKSYGEQFASVPSRVEQVIYIAQSPSLPDAILFLNLKCSHFVGLQYENECTCICYVMCAQCFKIPLILPC